VKNEARNAAHAADLPSRRKNDSTMRARFVTLRDQSLADALLARRSRRGDGWATQNQRVGGIGPALPTGKRLQSAESVHIFVLILIASFAYPTSAVTLRDVLRTTLERNPAILEAKAGLEQAAGQRLVFRSIVWPDFDLNVPAGVQYGHRAGESGVKGFAVGRGNLNRRCSTWLCRIRFAWRHRGSNRPTATKCDRG